MGTISDKLNKLVENVNVEADLINQINTTLEDKIKYAEWSEAEDSILNGNISGIYNNNRITIIRSYAFTDCSKLTSVNFPACTSIGNSAFDGCTNLTSVSFPACTSIGDFEFYMCTKLTSVSFPACTSITYGAFCGCSKLTSVNLPVCTSIAYSAFGSCYRLSSLTLGASKVCTLAGSSVFNSTPYTGYSTYFSGTPCIYVPSSLLTSYKTATNWSYFSSYIVKMPVDKPNLGT